MSSSVLKHQHTSLQFSDNERQQRHDVRKLFTKGRAFPIKTGTESAPGTFLYDMVEEFAREFNHVLSRREGNWVAVDREIVKPRTVRRGGVFVARAKEIKGKGRDREFPWLQFTHVDERIGRIAVAGFHYSTRGKLPIDPNWHINQRYARKIGMWMKNKARGTKIALGAGDFNMIDSMKKQDWAFGEDFTSMADELKDWKNTGHGPIDGFVSYDHDHRVKAKKFVVLDDSEFHFYSDHYVCRGTWTIRHLKGA